MSKNVNWTKIGDVLRQLLLSVKSPVFLTMLALAFMLWYAQKLSYVYTTDLSVPVRIDGEPYRVKCIVEARGTEIWAQRFAIGGKINLSLTELSPRVESAGDEYYTITPASLGSAIMQRAGSLRVIEVLETPKISINSAR